MWPEEWLLMLLKVEFTPPRRELAESDEEEDQVWLSEEWIDAEGIENQILRYQCVVSFLIASHVLVLSPHWAVSASGAGSYYIAFNSAIQQADLRYWLIDCPSPNTEDKIPKVGAKRA